MVIVIIAFAYVSESWQIDNLHKDQE